MASLGGKVSLVVGLSDVTYLPARPWYQVVPGDTVKELECHTTILFRLSLG